MHTDTARAPAHSDRYFTPKVPRDRIVRIQVETEICPQVMLRVLGLLVQRWFIPLSIEATQGEDRLRLVVEIEAPASFEASALLSRIDAIIMVRSARLAEARTT